VSVVDCIEGDDSTGLGKGPGEKATRKGTGRLEAADNGDAVIARDGLHSAPNGRGGGAAGGTRAGLHSAPPAGGTPKGDTASSESLGHFIIEGPDVDAAAVDAYLVDILGSRIVKDLRRVGSEWASRVDALEAIHKLIKKQAKASEEDEGAAVPTGQAADGVTILEAERVTLFKACVTVLVKALSDKGECASTAHCARPSSILHLLRML
jgi:hypothetical protein